MKNLKEISLEELVTVNGGTEPGVMSEPGNEGCEVPGPFDDIFKSI